MMNGKWIQQGILILAILLVSSSAISLFFGYRIREFWPTAIPLYEIGLPSIIGLVGVILFGFGGMSFAMSRAKKKNIE
jgi:hypothetical protein